MKIFGIFLLFVFACSVSVVSIHRLNSRELSPRMEHRVMFGWAWRVILCAAAAEWLGRL